MPRVRQIDWNKLEVSGEGADAAEVVDLLRGLPDPLKQLLRSCRLAAYFSTRSNSNIAFEFFIFFMFSCTRSA